MTDTDDARRLQDALGADFELLSSIGYGGMGAVYKAKHRRLDRLVAVKIVRCVGDTTADPNAAKRLTNEAQALAALKHNNIVEVLTLHPLADGGQAMIMDYVEGRDFGKVIADCGALDTKRARKLFVQCASALAAAHSVGIIHRDIKPGNLLVTTDDNGEETIKVLDFGLAKFTESADQKLTKTGTIMGSPIYMSPEQCSASTNLDGRSDIYSLGCVLFEAVTGHAPFDGESAFEVLMKHTLEDVPDVDCDDAALAAVIKKCTRRDADERFPSAYKLLEALAQPDYQFDGVPIEEPPCKRLPAVPLVVSVTVCLAVIGGAVALFCGVTKSGATTVAARSPFDEYPATRLVEVFDKMYSKKFSVPPRALLEAIAKKDKDLTDPDELKMLGKCFERLSNVTNESKYREQATPYYLRAIDGYYKKHVFSRFEVPRVASYYCESGHFDAAEELLRRDAEMTRALPPSISKNCYIAKTMFNDLSLSICKKDWKRATLLHNRLAEAFAKDPGTREFIEAFDTVDGDILAKYAGTFNSKYYPRAQTKEPGKPGL